MVTDHRDNERNPVPVLHGLYFPISSKGSFIYTITQNNVYTKLHYTSCGTLDITRNNSMDSPCGIEPATYCTIIKCFTTELRPALGVKNVSSIL